MRLPTTTASRALRRIESTTSSCAGSFTSGQPQQPLSSFNARYFSQLRSRANRSNAVASRPPNYNHLAVSSSPILARTIRTLHTTLSSTKGSSSSRKRKLAHNNEPIPTEAPQTNFSQMDMLGQTPIPSTSIDVCSHDGFTLNSGVIISHGDGALLIGGEAFAWRPWEIAPILNAKGQFDLSEESLAIFENIWPRPDLLIIGTGIEIRPLSAESRKAIRRLGMRVDVLDTRNAASQFNLLATERGVDDVAAVLVPLGWKP